MDFSEREKIVRRISSGKLYCTIKYLYSEYGVIFTDPTLALKTEADWKYKQAYDRYKNEEDIITLDESYQILKENGSWSDSLEKELVETRKDIKELSSKLPLLKFKKAEERAVKTTIEKGKNRAEKLEMIKNQLWTSTVEFMSESVRKRFIMSRVTQIDDKNLLERPAFLDMCSVYYYKENLVDEKTIRELARTDPWRLYWTVSKDTGTPLFPHSVVEMTELQYAIILWSRIYDFAYESSNRPDDDVLNDDTKFDAWYQNESGRISSDLKKRSLENSVPNINGIGGQEVFVPADVEGAKEVYELNNMDAKNRIAQREKAISKTTQIAESQLPDVKRDIKMEANRLASAGTSQRSK